MIIQNAYEQLVEKLSGIYDKREAANIAAIIFEDAFAIRNFQRQDLLSDTDVKRLGAYTARLLTSEPWQYVLGEADFMGLKLKVNKNVLIPRPETEEMVSLVLEHLRFSKVKKVLDIGTGSGCIAIAIKANLPQVKVTALDVSPVALDIARLNAKKLNLEIDFLELDILNRSSWPEHAKFECIISNPPYIPVSEHKHVQNNVHRFEPHIALYTANNDPLIFYKVIAEFSSIHLTDGGLLFFECNAFSAKRVVELLDHQNFQSVQLYKDMRGKDRVVQAIK